MTERECIEVGSTLVEAVGWLHQIALALTLKEFHPIDWELERHKFNDYLGRVKSLWARFVILVQEAQVSISLPIDRMTHSLRAIAPL